MTAWAAEKFSQQMHMCCVRSPAGFEKISQRPMNGACVAWAAPIPVQIEVRTFRF
jgi:hypothetical protein